jgi:hypothetical protein
VKQHVESTLKEQPVRLEEAVAKGVETSGADIMARISSLEDTVLTLAEALLRPSIRRLAAHSHSIVPGGLLVMSSATRFTSRTSLVIRVEIRPSTS